MSSNKENRKEEYDQKKAGEMGDLAAGLYNKMNFGDTIECVLALKVPAGDPDKKKYGILIISKPSVKNVLRVG